MNEHWARNLKISAYQSQRKAIIGVIENGIANPLVATSSITYVGIIFPEIRKELEEQGFTITTLDSPEDLSRNGGKIYNIISISESIKLTDEENEESRRRAKEAEEIDKKARRARFNSTAMTDEELMQKAFDLAFGEESDEDGLPGRKKPIFIDASDSYT